MVYVRSDTQRQGKELTHSRDNENDAGFQNGHGETAELVRACGEKSRTHSEESVERGCSAVDCRTRNRDGPGSNTPFATVSKFGHFRPLQGEGEL